MANENDKKYGAKWAGRIILVGGLALFGFYTAITHILTPSPDRRIEFYEGKNGQPSRVLIINGRDRLSLLYGEDGLQESEFCQDFNSFGLGLTWCTPMSKKGLTGKIDETSFPDPFCTSKRKLNSALNAVNIGLATLPFFAQQFGTDPDGCSSIEEMHERFYGSNSDSPDSL